MNYDMTAEGITKRAI